MTIQQIYNLVNYITNKEQFGRTLKVSDFNLACEAAIYNLIKKRYGLPEHYSPGMPLPEQAWEITQKITDDLRILKKWLGGQNYPKMSLDQYGRAAIPEDYWHHSSMRYTGNGQENVQVEVLKDDEIGARLDNPNRSPDYANPICVFYHNYIQFFPRDLQFVDFTYLRLPTVPVYAVTTDPETDVQTYDPVNSVQLELPDDMHPDFVWYVLNYIGVNLRAEQVYSYSNEKINTGV